MGLPAEEAYVRLEAVADRYWRAHAAERIGALADELRAIAAVLVTPDPDSGDTDARERLRQELDWAASELDELDDDGRLAVFEALHPQLGPVLARWWVEARSQPFATGWLRRAYRAVDQPSATRRARLSSLRGWLDAVGPFDRDITWVAVWAPFLGHVPTLPGYRPFGSVDVGPLLAAAIDIGGEAGDAVFTILREVMTGDHEISVMGRHAIVGMLRCGRPGGWALVEGMLVAAQRQEGLRQAILEVADEGHPESFDRVLGLILDEDLLRFAATVRAVGCWLGFNPEVDEIPQIAERVERLLELRRAPGLRRDLVVGGDAWSTYLALCAEAMYDAVAAIDLASDGMSRREAPERAAVVSFLASVGISGARRVLLEALDDPHPGVAGLAQQALRWTVPWRGTGGFDEFGIAHFDALLRLFHRLPERAGTVDPLGVVTVPIDLDRAAIVAQLLSLRGDRALSTFVPLAPAMDSGTRARFARIVGEADVVEPEVREVLLRLVGDRSASVRQEAVAALSAAALDPGEAPALEALLTRKASDLRRGVIGLLAHLPERHLGAAAERLWSGDKAQRDAACELVAAVDDFPERSELAARFAADGADDRQRELLAPVLGTPAVEGADDPGLGLYVPDRRAPVERPTASVGPGDLVTDTARRIVSALDDLAEELKDTPFLLTNSQGSSELLLADARWLPSPFAVRSGSAAGVTGDLVLGDRFRTWWSGRSGDLREDDLDALRAFAAVSLGSARSEHHYINAGDMDWWWELLDEVGRPGDLGVIRHRRVVAHVLAWMVADSASVGMVDSALDAVDATCAAIPDEPLELLTRLQADRRYLEGEWRNLFATVPWSAVVVGLLGTRPELFGPPQLARWFNALRWLDEPVPGTPRWPVTAQLVLRCHDEGIATDDDVYDLLLARRGRVISDLTRHRRAAMAAAHPSAVALADQVRDRVLAVELARGELETPASGVAVRLGSIHGCAPAMALLARLGRSTLVRGWLGSNLGRDVVFSRLLRVSYPAPDDDAATLRAAVEAERVPERRLLELAMYAPQWAALVEEVVGWDGLADAVWWFHAHTKDDHWSVDDEVRETWAALSAERTPLTGEDLVAGAVDVAWYIRVSEQLGAGRWKQLHAVAKLASGGNGHRRAQLFAEAMRGEVDEEGLTERVRAKRHQDSVRALGLLPLPSDPARRDAAMLRRYQLLREFERGSAKFGAQRRASEQTAVRVGIENLARSSGLSDPQRFVWAMEAAEAGDLADGPVARAVDDVTVTLSVDAEGRPALTVERAGRKLASVPKAQAKHPAVVELRERKTALTRQAARVRRSLEDAMVRGDPFTTDDLAGLDRHPVVAPMLDLVVLVDEGGNLVNRVGGRFVQLDGATVAPSGTLRVAHPLDLLASGCWIDWQSWQFASERRQPFKQVFRELYVLTDAERRQSPGSRRYEGHQVQPRQAAALLGSRGWVTDHDAGESARPFLAHGVVARLTFLDGFLTPAEVELPRIDAVYFTRPGDPRALHLADVPPRAFSEAMRDLDLVVSVAHAGGVDPEASASTVEMRAALVRETVRILHLDNVRFVDGPHVVIEGSLGEYSIHLGSGVVHRRPGGSICIIPVDSQRRGRIFLPFADDDPKTAEVISKVLLLARDSQIKDPSILEQLRS